MAWPARKSSSRLDLLSLRLLLAAIEEGNLARAAERENISISGVSRRITELEQRWGVQLLHRHDRGVKAAAAATSILEQLRQVFALLDDIVDGIGEVGSGIRGVIRVRANMTAVAGDLASYMAQFTITHPEVAVELDESTTLDIIHAVRVGLCDVGIISAASAGDDRAIAVRTLDESWARRQVMLCTRSPQLTTLLKTFMSFLCGQSIAA